MSPIQARYGLVPDVSRCRRFGCVCYTHIPRETREKGFVDKAYKCYFLGIHHATQAYLVWIIDMSVEKVTPNVLFDEAHTVTLKLDNVHVPVSQDRKSIKDFIYLIGMVYRDDEDKLLYVTKRVVVQRGDIVCYRCVYVHNVIGQEEPRPIHVADVERMLRVYLLDHTPGVVLADDVSATKVEILERLPGAEPSSRVVAPSVAAKSNILESGAVHTRVNPSGDDSSERDVMTDVQQTPVGQVQSGATTAHVSSEVGPPPSATSHRFPRSAHNKPRFAVPIGKKDDHAMCVSVNHNGDCFDLYMPDMLSDSSEFAFLSGPPASAAELEKWKLADLSEVKSLVMEHNVWDVCEPPAEANLITSK
jgi:hypothetical protein